MESSVVPVNDKATYQLKPLCMHMVHITALLVP